MSVVKTSERLHWLMPARHYLACLLECEREILPREGVIILGLAVQLLKQQLALDAIIEVSKKASIYMVDEDCELFLGEMSLPNQIEVIKTSSLADLIMQYDLHQTWG